jgi:hypothetical protein
MPASPSAQLFAGAVDCGDALSSSLPTLLFTAAGVGVHAVSSNAPTPLFSAAVVAAAHAVSSRTAPSIILSMLFVDYGGGAVYR